MCGVTGLVSASRLNAGDMKCVERMSSGLVHRGPDSAGSFSEENVILAVRRLRIIDIAGGDQPLFNEDKSLVLVVNGEIYNYIELRKELESRGHVFRTRSDCETILHLYEESGHDCLHKLRGMFAFALYDKKRAEVFIARDRMGEKPLYYRATSSGLIFSSELKSLLAGQPALGLELDLNAVNLYLHYQYVPEPLTPIKGVKKLPAAHFIRIKTKNFSFAIEKYWDVEDAAPVNGDPVELIRESFDELGKYIIRADVPVGIALSGGLDSSAIACAAARHCQGGLTAFTVGYPGHPGYDEREQARSLAERLEMKFRSIELRTEDLVESFPRLVYAMDDPIADIAAYGYYSVSKLARENGVPVLLFGFGGDEIFWGYRWARESLRRNLIKKGIREGAAFRHLPAADVLSVLSHVSRKRMLLEPLTSVKEIIAELSALKRKFTENPSRFILWDETPDFKTSFKFIKDICAPGFEGAVDDGLLYAPFSTDDWSSVQLKTCRFMLDPWNVSNSVPQGDRLGMAFSVENRLPFLDHKFIELVVGLRKTYMDDYKLGPKAWFREAMRGIIPEDVLARRKTGFTPPREEWLKAVVGRYSERCRGGRLEAAGILRRDRMDNFFDDISSGGGKLFFAYKLVLLELWLQEFMGGNAPSERKA